MCFSSKQPTTPQNAPAYKPEEAHQYFEMTKTDEDGKVTNLNPKVPLSSNTKLPTQSSPKHEQIRM